MFYYLFINIKSYTQQQPKKSIKKTSTINYKPNTTTTTFFKYPSVIYAQILLETGHFKSKLYTQNNNLFGMKLPKQRKTTATKELNGYAFYSSLQDCLEDRMIWDSMYTKEAKTKKEYYIILSKHYAEDTNYISKLQKLEKYYVPL